MVQEYRNHTTMHIEKWPVISPQRSSQDFPSKERANSGKQLENAEESQQFELHAILQSPTPCPCYDLDRLASSYL
jgi:hypothetical protein